MATLDLGAQLTVRAGGSVATIDTLPLVTGNFVGAGTSTTPWILGEVYVDPAKSPGTTMDCEIVGYTSANSSNVQTTFVLYNLTDATTVGSVSTTSTMPAFVSITGIAKPAAAKLYELRVYLGAGASATDRGIVQMARLRFY